MAGDFPAPSADVLDSWKAIAGYLGRDVRTVIRWERSRGLPVHRLPGGPKASVYALRSEVEAWRKRRAIHAVGREQDETAPAAPAPKPASSSVAVLPLANPSADKENDYFGDGLADEIITALARLPGLRVIARTSSFAFRGKDQDVREIGLKLGVGSLIEGSVQRAGNRLRVHVQLVSCSDGCHLWADRYDRELTDIFSVQDDIAASVTAALKVAVDSPRPPRKTPDLEAYTCWMQGRYYQLGLRSFDEVRKATEFFSRAVAIDPQFAPAHMALGESLLNLAVLGLVSPRGIEHQARREIETALALDPRLGEAHAADGILRALFDFDWTGAGNAFSTALTLAPGQAGIHRRRAGCLLIPLLRLEEAEEEARTSMELDPICPESQFLAALVLLFQRDYARAEANIRMMMQVGSPNPYTIWVLGIVAAMQQRFDEAIASCEKAARLFGGAPVLSAGLGMLYGMAGRTDEARRLLEQMDQLAARGGHVSPVFRAMVLVGINDFDGAFASLERAVEGRDPHILHLPGKPVYDRLRGDPRFAALLRKMNLDG